jgi:hypothetical protein
VVVVAAGVVGVVVAVVVVVGVVCGPQPASTIKPVRVKAASIFFIILVLYGAVAVET